MNECKERLAVMQVNSALWSQRLEEAAGSEEGSGSAAARECQARLDDLRDRRSRGEAVRDTLVGKCADAGELVSERHPAAFLRHGAETRGVGLRYCAPLARQAAGHACLHP